MKSFWALTSKAIHPQEQTIKEMTTRKPDRIKFCFHATARSDGYLRTQEIVSL